MNELEQLAFRDALTGVPNRRYFELKVEQGLEEHRRFGRLYGLLLFDVDRIKQVNDSHGHDVGDAVLKTVARTLVEGLRTVDVVGRWGGEEFLDCAVLRGDGGGASIGYGIDRRDGDMPHRYGRDGDSPSGRADVSK